jgi:hypothetical protein
VGTGRLGLARLLGRQVRRSDGTRLGRVRDVLADVSGGLGDVRVTGVLVGGPQGVVVDPGVLVGRGGPLVVPDATTVRPFAGDEPGTLRLRRDVLDAPVVTVDPPRRARVADVVLSTGDDDVRVLGLELGSAHVLSRALRRLPPAPREVVGLADAHVVSPRAHRAQLDDPDSLVRRPDPHGLADVVTRLPVGVARDVLARTDPGVASRAVELLHPHVRSRVGGAGRRRTRRTHGWRVHRPGSHTGAEPSGEQ